MTLPIHPIYVGCHLCHAHPGDGCRWSVTEAKPFHGRRINRAESVAEKREQDQTFYAKHHIDVEHAIAQGSLCTPYKSGDPLCSKCGQEIAELKAIVEVPFEDSRWPNHP